MSPLSVMIYLLHLSQLRLTILQDFHIFILYGCGNGLELKSTLQPDQIFLDSAFFNKLALRRRGPR